MAVKTKTKPATSNLTLEELVLQTRLAGATSRQEIVSALGDHHVPLDSPVRVAAIKRLRTLARQHMLSIEGCEPLIIALRDERWWPNDDRFRSEVVKRIFSRAKTWQQFAFVKVHTTAGTKMHRAASRRMYELLRTEYQLQIDATVTFAEACELLSAIHNLGNRQSIDKRRLRPLYKQLLQQLYDRAATYSEISLLLSFKTYTGDQLEMLWQRALAQANTIKLLECLRYHEPPNHQGECRQKALDLCMTMQDCLEAYKYWPVHAGGSEFGLKAVELADSFAQLDGLRWSFGSPDKHVRFIQRLLHLANTTEEMHQLLDRLDDLKSQYYHIVQQLADDARVKLNALYVNQVMQSTSVSELMTLYGKTSFVPLDTRKLAFKQACSIATTSDEWLCIYRSAKQVGPCRDLATDAAVRGLELARQQADVELLLRWVRVFSDDDPMRQQALQLFLDVSNSRTESF